MKYSRSLFKSNGIEVNPEVDTSIFKDLNSSSTDVLTKRLTISGILSSPKFMCAEKGDPCSKVTLPGLTVNEYGFGFSKDFQRYIVLFAPSGNVNAVIRKKVNNTAVNLIDFLKN
jgi:hypothetical protein